MSWRTKCLLIPQLNILNKSQIPPVPAHNHKGCAGQGLNFTAGLPRKIRLPPARERGSFQYSYLVAESIEIGALKFQVQQFLETTFRRVCLSIPRSGFSN
jgi:hypothetical protein